MCLSIKLTRTVGVSWLFPVVVESEFPTLSGEVDCPDVGLFRIHNTANVFKDNEK